jgi:hypothetical protein
MKIPATSIANCTSSKACAITAVVKSPAVSSRLAARQETAIHAVATAREKPQTDDAELGQGLQIHVVYGLATCRLEQ